MQGGSLLIQPRKSPKMIAGSDKGSDTDPFTDLDKDEDQTKENVQSACAKASVCTAGIMSHVRDKQNG